MISERPASGPRRRPLHGEGDLRWELGLFPPLLEPYCAVAGDGRPTGYGRQAAASVVELVIDSLAAMAAEFPSGTGRNPKPTAPSERQLMMRKQLADLAGSEYPRIREAAVPLTTLERPQVYVKLGIDILVRGIESSAPEKRCLMTESGSD